MDRIVANRAKLSDKIEVDINIFTDFIKVLDEYKDKLYDSDLPEEIKKEIELKM
jgi:hypothetical protein